VAIDGHGRVGLVAGEYAVEGLPHRPHAGLVEIALAVGRRVPGREQELVAVAQRDREMLGEVQDHLCARPRTARLDKAQVPRRHLRLEREVELAQAPVFRRMLTDLLPLG